MRRNVSKKKKKKKTRKRNELGNRHNESMLINQCSEMFNIIHVTNGEGRKIKRPRKQVLYSFYLKQVE